MSMDLSGVILAGGQSLRMGHDKAWLELEGEPLIARALATLREVGIDEIFISGKPGTDYSGLRCPVLFDRQPGLGPLGGIECALDACSTPKLLVLAVDLPHMTVDFLREMVASCEPPQGVVPVLFDQLEPLAAVYPKRCHALLRGCLAQSRLSARSFAQACLDAQEVRRFEVPALNLARFQNWNRPDDIR
jgi:molybdopterin-guanine dinucleotide biosynthesis protein A